MARDAFETDVGGELRDRYGRPEYVLTPKHAALVPTDTTRGYQPTDGDGRLQIPIQDANGNDLTVVLATDTRADPTSPIVAPVAPRNRALRDFVSVMDYAP